MNRKICNNLTICGLVLACLSMSAQARYANQVSTYGQLRAQQPSEAITVCYYRPKVWEGEANRAYTVELTGHVSCEKEHKLGVLYYLKHDYK